MNINEKSNENTPNVQQNFFTELEARGIVYQLTDPNLKQHLQVGPVTVYCGFDPTSDDLHVGSLLPLLTLKRFQDAGHRPLIVLGGATGMIGDPSGKSNERNLQTLEQVAHNLAAIQKTVSKFLDFDHPITGAKIINNAAFYEGMYVLDFLRDIGKHFTINHMIAKDSVKGRMEDREHGISYTEFSYMLLQAYDFYHLHKKEGCTLQIGASDQWGNITAGTDLIRRKLALTGDATATFGMTHPLITRSDGAKFGKSESGTIWLNAKKTSPFQFYQFFISSPDDKVLEWLKFLTFVPLTEMEKIEASLRSEPEKKTAQIRLAQELTALVHGTDAMNRAVAATQALFSTEIKNLDAQTLQEVFSEAPTITRKLSELSSPTAGLLDALVEAGLFQSKGAARKEIPAGGVYINNERTTDVALVLSRAHLIAGNTVVLRKGKKHYALIRFV